MFIFDPTFVLLIPGLVLAIWAQSKVKSAYAKWSKYRASSGMTGGYVARALLEQNGVRDVVVEETGGNLTDHFDPRKKRVRLSKDVYSGTSVASLAIAAHETGHVLQHNTGYVPVGIRNTLVPVANIGTFAAWPLFIVGLLIGNYGLAQIGVVVFAGALLFHLVTLPVEYNASSRALSMLTAGGYVKSPEETHAVKDVLGAAALTYVAATAMAALQLLRMVAILGGVRRR